ncbi:MAG: hypothetical protein OXI03_05735, partial [Chloroflexota bacterium]|nr:hypothetical protein [Chloroflexota bacterium]
FQDIHKQFIDEGIASVTAAAGAAAGRDVTVATTAGDEAPPKGSKLVTAAEAEGLERVRARPG